MMRIAIISGLAKVQRCLGMSPAGVAAVEGHALTHLRWKHQLGKNFPLTSTAERKQKASYGQDKEWKQRIKKHELSVSPDQSCRSPASKTCFCPKVREKTEWFDALARQEQPDEPRVS